ncbi:MAG: outer membrane beta-barrel protein [Acidobacteria bacterium]|nr:outer membrane beta-barrel protein [Acidobacteriota bacterium]
MRLLLILSLPLVLGGSAAAQRLQFGVIGGAAATRDYIRSDDNGSGSRSPIGGPSLEWRFTEHFSVESNAIYRRLQREQGGPTVTWEFPVLAKYRFTTGRVNPFVEGGVSFRATGNRNTHPSHFGVTAGAGVDLLWHGLTVSPTVRYTRWRDDVWWTQPSKPDQVELLVGVSHAAFSDRKPLGERVSLGAVVGSMLVRPLPRSSSVETFTTPDFPDGIVAARSRTYSRSWLAGPRIDVRLTDRWSVTAEANYRQIRFRQTTLFAAEGGLGVPTSGEFHNKAAVSWQFPVLVRRSFGDGPIRPYLAAGPSFRLAQTIGGAKLSTVGASAGLGLQFEWRALRFDPGLRYTYWGSSKYLNGETAPDGARPHQLDLLMGVTF